MRNKIYIVDAVLLVGTILIVGVLYGLYEKNVSFSPIEEQGILFSFNVNVDRILISEDLNFEEKREIIVEDSALIRLKPGKYYLDIEGEEIKEITVVEKEIVLQLREVGLFYGVFNYGETKEVESYHYGNFEKNFVFSGGGNE